MARRKSDSPGKTIPARSEKFDLDAVLITIIRLLLVHPPGTITFSKVARASGVARSTLYYYFGSSRDVMLEEAARFGMAKFAQLSSFGDAKDYPDWQTFQRERFLASMRLLQKAPWAPELYFRYRNDRGKLGGRIRQMEKDYLHRLGESFSLRQGQKSCARAIHVSTYLRLGLLWGMAQEPELWAEEKHSLPLAELMTKVATLVMDVDFAGVESRVASLKNPESDPKRRAIASRKNLPA